MPSGMQTRAGGDLEVARQQREMSRKRPAGREPRGDAYAGPRGGQPYREPQRGPQRGLRASGGLDQADKQPKKRRSQWGHDRRTGALPVVPMPVSDRRIAMTRLAIIITVTAWIGYVVNWLLKDFLNPIYSSTTSRAESILYLLIITMLTASAFAYLLSRLGFCYRTRKHHRASRATLDHFFDDKAPTLTAIVPSYKEEEHVIRNTLLSAALQEYPHKRIVLLIDDPPVPKTRQDRDQLNAARALPGKIAELLAPPKARFVAAAAEFEAKYANVPWPD